MFSLTSTQETLSQRASERKHRQTKKRWEREREREREREKSRNINYLHTQLI